MKPGDPTRILIVDDEAPARTRLRQLLEATDGFRIIGEAVDGQDALESATRLKPDIMLLDVRMPGSMDGLDVAAHLAGWEQAPAVIFTTAYDQYAIQAFEAQAIGYLLKPVRRERLQQAVERAARIGRAQLGRLPDRRRRNHLCVQHTRGLELIPVPEIIWFQAGQKYVTAHHTAGEALLSEPLKDLEQEFGELFLRVHRNALVAVAFVHSLERSAGGWQVCLRSGQPALPVSRRHLGEVKRRLRTLA